MKNALKFSDHHTGGDYIMSVYLGSKLVSPQGGFTLAGMVDLLYPVGSIYLSVNNVNPGMLFGGTWEAFGSGKTLVGVDTNDTDFDTAEETGGEKTHTLTIDEIPSHKHSIREEYGTTSVNSTASGAYSQIAGDNAGTQVWVDAPISETGGDLAHNNMPPYITCYMWKRTA